MYSPLNSPSSIISASNGLAIYIHYIPKHMQLIQYLWRIRCWFILIRWFINWLIWSTCYFTINCKYISGLEIYFFEQTGKAKLSLEWESASILPRIIISSNYLYCSKNVGNDHGNSVEYIANIPIISFNTLPSNCDVFGDGLINSVAENMTTFTIIAKDSFGNASLSRSSTWCSHFHCHVRHLTMSINFEFLQWS